MCPACYLNGFLFLIFGASGAAIANAYTRNSYVYIASASILIFIKLLVKKWD